MLEIFDNINRSQDYLIGLGFKVVKDKYEKFRQFIIKNDRAEYDKFRKYLIDNGIYDHSDNYFILELKKLKYQDYYVTIEYAYVRLINRHYLELTISNGIMVFKFEFTFYYGGKIDFTITINNRNCISEKIHYNNFKEFFFNLVYVKHNYENHTFEIDNLEYIDDIHNKIDCELINKFNPMLFKMFMTIFNKPTMKNANSISIDN